MHVIYCSVLTCVKTDRPKFSFGNVGAINLTLIFDLVSVRPTAAIGHRLGRKLKLDNYFRDLVLPLCLSRTYIAVLH
jgi:hypothetical protein